MNRIAASELLAPYLARPPEELLPALRGRFSARADAEPDVIEDFVRFHGINRPDTSHGRWYLEQMQSAGQLPHQIALDEIVHRAFRPDLYLRFVGTR